MDPLTKEEYELLYEISIAEDRYYKSLARIFHEAEVYGPVLEAADYIALNEGVKDTIMKYLQNVTAAVSKAWNAFKEKRVKNEIIELINKHKDKLDTAFKMFMPKEFEVPQIDNWNKLRSSIQVLKFEKNSYEGWVRDKILEDPKDFIKAKYPQLVDGDKAIIDVMHEKVFKTQQPNEVMHKDAVKKYSEFLLEYGEQYNEISKSIEAMNASNKNIEARLNEITNESTYFLGEEIFAKLAEAEGDNNNNQQTETPEEKEKRENQFRSTDPNDQNGGAQKKAAQDRKYIVTYYKASTQVLSAELKTCNALKTASEKIVSNFIKLQMKGKVEEEKKPEQQQNNQQPDKNAPTQIKL